MGQHIYSFNKWKKLSVKKILEIANYVKIGLDLQLFTILSYKKRMK